MGKIYRKKSKSRFKKSGRKLLEERFAREERLAKDLDKQAANRRKLISKLDRDTALYATKEFAKLGLYQ